LSAVGAIRKKSIQTKKKKWRKLGVISSACCVGKKAWAMARVAEVVRLWQLF
jgi:hypothetical protein